MRGSPCVCMYVVVVGGGAQRLLRGPGPGRRHEQAQGGLQAVNGGQHIYDRPSEQEEGGQAEGAEALPFAARGTSKPAGAVAAARDNE